MITLYGSAQSRSFKALWALEEAGIPYEYKQVNIGKTDENGTQTEQYKRLNIQGKVPTLVDDDFVLTESAAILNYIANTSENKTLIPHDNNILQAQYDQICYFVLSELEQPLWTFVKHMFVLPKELRIKRTEIKKITAWEFAKQLETLSHLLNNRQFAVNNHFTMADIMISFTLRWAKSIKFEIPEDLMRYSDRMYQRPACQRALKKA
ncbi:MAG: glutathione S-transferase [Methylophaga sp.]|nr:MAG: glutathione S-transferase [Methylophaga sp.]